MKILGLPGFLGLSSDFDELYEMLGEQGLIFEPRTWAVSSDSQLFCELQSWSEWSNGAIEELIKWKKKGPLVGIGYSLGGRLLLKLVEKKPDLFDGLVFLSVNPGLTQQSEKKSRFQQDMNWANRFEKEPWEALLADWNAQAVFRGSNTEPVRDEKNYSREVLARVLRVFSLAHQPDYRTAISASNVPQMWMAGGDDIKFTSYLNELQETNEKNHLTKNKGTIHFEIVPSASHRLVFQNPSLIATHILQVVRSLKTEKY